MRTIFLVNVSAPDNADCFELLQQDDFSSSFIAILGLFREENTNTNSS